METTRSKPLASENSINLLIIHQSEEEAERILSLLRNYQIAVRPTRCMNEDDLAGILERKPIDMVLCQQLQNDLPCQVVVDHLKRMGLNLPVVALLENFDPDLIQDLITKYIVRSQLDTFNSTTSSASIALALLQS